jgi:hypothetical protein
MNYTAFFNPIAHVWVLSGAKTTGQFAKKVCLFLNLIFSAVKNFKFQCDAFSNLKDVSQSAIPKSC